MFKLSAANSISRSFSYLLPLFVLLAGGLNCRALAQAAGGAAGQPMQLDLGSEKQTMLHVGSDAVIDSGSGRMQVSSGALVTPAQYAAIVQVLSGSQQSLKIDGAGKAVGGSFALSAIPQTQLGSLNVPANVTVRAAQTANSLSLSGALINSGTLLAIPQNNTAVFQLNAAQIQNNLGALISSPGHLAIKSVGNIVNLGSITAGGVLSIAAGGSITNGVAGQSSAALMSGTLGTNLNSAIGNIINSGVISSAAGNVVLSTATAQNLNINNTLGSIIANLAAVNIQNNSVAVKGNINIVGGLVGATAIKFSSNDGVVDGFLDELRGPVDVFGGAAHIAVNGGSLSLRDIVLSGDPSFVNTAGDVVLNPNSGSIMSFPGQDLAVLASRDVIAGGGLSLIDLSAPGGGGDLFVSAGLTISPNGGNFDVGGPSASGGSVRLQGVSVNTSASNADARAGDVTFLAHDNNNISEGTFGANDMGFIQIAAIDASSPAGTGGTVHIIAQSDSVVISAPISTNGIQPGPLNIISGEPVSNGLSFLANGSLNAGSFSVDSNNVTHDLVPISFAPGVMTAANVYGPVFINASGDTTFADNSVVLSEFSVQVFSRKSTVDLGVGSTFRANSGSLIMASDQTLGIGTGTTLEGRDALILSSLTGSVTGGGGHTINSAWGRVHITGIGGDLSIGNAGTTSMYALGGLVLEAKNNINLSDNQFVTDRDINIFAGNNINIGSGDLRAGTLNGSPHPGVYGAGEIHNPGAVVLYATNNIQNGANLHSVGSEILLAALNGNIQLGAGSTYNAVGGNIFLLAGGSISGSNNSFSSQAAGQNGSFAGGNIEVSAGFPFTPIAFNPTDNLPLNGENETAILKGIVKDEKNVTRFLRTFPDPPYSGPALDANGLVGDPSIMGSNVSIINSGGDFGRVRTTSSGGSINLGGSQINLNKGSIFFDALGAGSNIDLQNSQFSTASYKVVPDGGFINGSSSSETFISGVKAFNLSFDLPEIFSDVSNINVPSERQARISMLGSRGGRPVGQESQIIAAAMGLNNNTIFDSRGFQGFDTGRIGSGSGGTSSSGSQFTGSGDGGGSVRVLNVGPMSASSAGPSGGNAPLNIMNDGGAAISPVRVAAERSDLVLFTTGGQVLTGNPGGSTGATAIGARGTTVSEEKGALLLHGGKLYANSGSNSMKIVTLFGTVVLQPDTSAAIEVRADGSGRIVLLSSKNKKEAAATLEHRGELIAILPGEALRFEPEDAEHANPDAPDRGVLVKEQVPVNSMIEKENEGFYTNRSIRLSGNASGAYLRMLERINKYVDSAEAQNAKTGGQATANLNAARPKSKVLGEPAHVLAAAGTIYQQETEGSLSIKVGSIFIRPEMEQTVKTSLGEMQVEAGASAEVQVKDGQVRFRSYSGPGKVRVHVAAKNMLLAPGQELVLQTQKPTRQEALPHDGIARRSLANFELPNGVYGVSGDFSILSAMQAAPHLRPLRVAVKKDHAELRANLLKTAASLTIVRAHQGRYFMASTQKSQLPDGAFTENGQMLESRVSYADQ